MASTFVGDNRVPEDYFENLADLVTDTILSTWEELHLMDRIDWCHQLEKDYPGWAIWEHEQTAIVLEKRHWHGWR